MNPVKLTMIAALFGLASGAALAADPDSDQARQERMDAAYSDYQGSNHSQGMATRTGNSIKRGAHRTGEAIKHGAEKVGHAIGKGVRKTGEAIDHGGEKMENASTPKQ